MLKKQIVPVFIYKQWNNNSAAIVNNFPSFLISLIIDNFGYLQQLLLDRSELIGRIEVSIRLKKSWL